MTRDKLVEWIDAIIAGKLHAVLKVAFGDGGVRDVNLDRKIAEKDDVKIGT